MVPGIRVGMEITIQQFTVHIWSHEIEWLGARDYILNLLSSCPFCMPVQRMSWVLELYCYIGIVTMHIVCSVGSLMCRGLQCQFVIKPIYTRMFHAGRLVHLAPFTGDEYGNFCLWGWSLITTSPKPIIIGLCVWINIGNWPIQQWLYYHLVNTNIFSILLCKTNYYISEKIFMLIWRKHCF